MNNTYKHSFSMRVRVELEVLSSARDFSSDPYRFKNLRWRVCSWYRRAGDREKIDVFQDFCIDFSMSNFHFEKFSKKKVEKFSTNIFSTRKI